MKLAIRKASIKYPCNQGCHDRFLIRNHDDLVIYASHCNLYSEEFITKLMRSDVPVSRWDHVWDVSPAGAALIAAMKKCTIEGGTPLFEYARHFDGRMERLAGYIDRGEKLVVNDSGGYFPLDDESMVISEYMWTPERVYTHKINKGSKYIALENDPAMEPDAHTELQSIDLKYSTVLELRKYDAVELVDVLSEFREQGGHTVYVYTTGLDRVQMSEYISAVNESGIRNMMFNFADDDLDGLLQFAKSECPEMNIKLSPGCRK